MSANFLRLSGSTVSSSAASVRGLAMTDYGLLFALGLALYLAVDPFDWRLERIGLTKHLPLIFALPPLILTLVGARVFYRGQRIPASSPVLRPLLMLGVMIIAGSVYARVHLNVGNTFLIAGLYILTASMAAAMLLRSNSPEKLLKAYFALLAVGGMAVFVGLAINYGSRQVYHELEYLVPPLAVWAAFVAKTRRARWLGVGFFLIAGVLFKKNTGYLADLLVVAYLVWFYARPAWSKRESLRRTAIIYTMLLVVVVAAGAVVFVLEHREAYLPTGNPEFRMRTYERAFQKFLGSPVWGTVFTDAGTEKFTGFDTGVAHNVLPTHSDILDIMAQGGVIGLMLWFWGLLRVARFAYTNVLGPRCRTSSLVPYAHALACMSLTGVLTYAFNPLFLQPAKSMLLWTNIGFLVGISLMAQKQLGFNSNERRS